MYSCLHGAFPRLVQHTHWKECLPKVQFPAQSSRAATQCELNQLVHQEEILGQGC